MSKLLSDAGRSFLRAFLGSLLILAPGVLAAPDLNRGVALGIAALVASIAAGLKALQVFAPALSFASLLQQPWAAWLDSFSRAFLATFLTSLIGILNMPSLDGWRAAGVAALVGAVTAGLRAVEGLFTTGDLPLRTAGIGRASG